MEPKIHRQLDTVERYFWLLDRISNMNFIVFAEIAAKIDEDHLHDALAQAQRVHPLLRVKIESKADHSLWFTPADNPLSLEILSVDSGNWQQPIEEEMSYVFSLGQAPLMRCRYLQFTDCDRSVLALTFHHAIADGRSGVTLLKEILSCLFLPGQDTHFPPTIVHQPMHAVFPEKYQWHHNPDTAMEVANTRKTEWKRYGRPHAVAWLDQLQVRRLPRFKRIELDQPATQCLLEQCKAHGATMHGALSAAQLLAKYQSMAATEALTFNLGSPIDMRPHLTGDIPATNLGLYVSLLFSNYRVENDSFWTLAREASKDIKVQVARGEAHLMFAYPKAEDFPPTEEGVAEFAKIMLSSPQSSMISNIGVVDPVQGAGHVEAISFVLCPTPYQVMFTAVSTYADRLILNMAYDAEKLPDDKAIQLAHWIGQALLHAGEPQ
jgi:NRPS condensation-like uncharacterized protein